MRDPYQELREDVLDEVSAVEETLDRLRKVSCRFDPKLKDYTTEPALGTYLMNFYNGIENILKSISKEYYLTTPKGESWHRELLALSATPPQGKIPVFTQDIVARLQPYRNFRHRFISGYGFQLNGEKMITLTEDIEVLWTDIKRSLEEFWNKLL